jgi:CheY-like chemotaxis protein
VVRDTGIGIPAANVSRLFTPFDRLGAEQLGIEGTGLGLALSRRLAQAMDADIGVRSVEGSGSTFWIDLPRDESLLGRLAAVERDVTPARAIRGVTATRRILYVEDNLSNLTLVQRVLDRRQDIELIPAMQGGLALELARLHRPDLVLLDLHLPDISGEEVFAQLRQAADCRDIPVVVLSADATQGQIDRLLAAGIDAYITKPLDVKPFIAIVDAVLERKRAA